MKLYSCLCGKVYEIKFISNVSVFVKKKKKKGFVPISQKVNAFPEIGVFI